MSGPAMARSDAVVEPRHPGHDRAVAEAQDQLACRIATRPRSPLDDADQMRMRRRAAA